MFRQVVVLIGFLKFSIQRKYSMNLLEPQIHQILPYLLLYLRQTFVINQLRNVLFLVPSQYQSFEISNHWPFLWELSCQSRLYPSFYLWFNMFLYLLIESHDLSVFFLRKRLFSNKNLLLNVLFLYKLMNWIEFIQKYLYHVINFTIKVKKTGFSLSKYQRSWLNFLFKVSLILLELRGSLMKT